MSHKTIVLADNSYTIRRIVELSFSEEKDIRLVTFENSVNLREKLLELRPEIVLVDIKLPEFSGYEVCKFIQETPSLKYTRVFLLKGGFEPIDERLLKDLRFEDIITKPFDSNALVLNIKGLLEQMAKQVPPEMPEEFPESLPEEFAEIEEIHENENDLSFLDVKEEMDSVNDYSPREISADPMLEPYDDEVLPSEEITLKQPEKDLLSPSLEDVDDNPFADDLYSPHETGGNLSQEELNIKRNIEMQEKELEIGSLTLEEFSIKKNIEDRHKQMLDDDFSGFGDENESGLPQTSSQAYTPVDMFSDSNHLFAPSQREPEDDTSEMFPGSQLNSSAHVFADALDEKEPTFDNDDDFVSMPKSEKSVPMEMDAESVDDLFAYSEPKSETPSFDTPAFDANAFAGDDDKLFGQESELSDYKYQEDYTSTPHEKEDMDFDSEPVSFDAPLKHAEPDFEAELGIPKHNYLDFESESPNPTVIDFDDEQSPEVPENAGLDFEAEPIDFDTEIKSGDSNFEAEPDDENMATVVSQPIDSFSNRNVDFSGFDEPAEASNDSDIFGMDADMGIGSNKSYQPSAADLEDVYEPVKLEQINDETDNETDNINITDNETDNTFAPIEQDDADIFGTRREPQDDFSYLETPVERKPVAEPPAPQMSNIPIETPVRKSPEPEPSTSSIDIPTQEILSKIEMKLTNAIKEMLWEIVPPLAEKIIREEISALKEEAEKTLK